VFELPLAAKLTKVSLSNEPWSSPRIEPQQFTMCSIAAKNGDDVTVALLLLLVVEDPEFAKPFQTYKARSDFDLGELFPDAELEF